MTEGTKTILQMMEEANAEIDEIKKDSNRGIMRLCTLLLPLFIERGEAKKAYRNHNTSYDIDYIEKKEDREKQIQVANAEVTDEKKKEKITDAELKRYADSVLKEDYREMQGYKETDEYLEIILEWYMNFINGYKFDKKDLTPVTKFNTDLPF